MTNAARSTSRRVYLVPTPRPRRAFWSPYQAAVLLPTLAIAGAGWFLILELGAALIDTLGRLAW